MVRCAHRAKIILMDANDSKPLSRDARRLTVTYYVEPQNLRTISIPVRRANALIVAFGTATLWTIASLTALTFRAFNPAPVGAGPEVAALPPQAVNAAAPVAVKSEDVPVTPSMVNDDPIPAAVAAVGDEDNDKDEAESASTETTANDLSVELPKAAPTATVGAAAAPAATETAPTPKPVLKVPDPEVIATAPAAGTEANPAVAGEAAIVEAPNFLYREGKFDASFKIKNRGKAELKGRVWGVATFVADGGRTIAIPSADGIDSERPDLGANAEHGVSYRARVLTAKELGFPVPDGASGHFSEVKIFVSADQNAAASDAPSPVYISSFSLDEQGRPLAR